MMVPDVWACSNMSIEQFSAMAIRTMFVCLLCWWFFCLIHGEMKICFFLLQKRNEKKNASENRYYEGKTFVSGD